MLSHLLSVFYLFFVFFKQKTAYEMRISDWSSDVCSSDLEVFGLDLRHTPSVEAFCAQLLATRPRLDFIINNACQTVRRPPAFYAHMMEGETAAMRDMPEDLRKLLGNYEGLRSPDLLPQADARALQAPAHDIPAAPGLTRAAEPAPSTDGRRGGQEGGSTRRSRGWT